MDDKMDDKLNSADINEKMDDGNEGKPKIHDSPPTASKSPIIPDLAGQKEASVETNVHENQDVTRAISICSPFSVERDQPKPLCALLPPSMEACTVHEMSQSFTSINRSQESLKTTTVSTEPDGGDLCAAIVMACLFCHPLDCLLATVRGCNGCVWWLCSYLCGCEATTLQPLLNIAHHCDLCECLGVRCFVCDCTACDICLPATECLDLAMEISQMLYH